MPKSVSIIINYIGIEARSDNSVGQLERFVEIDRRIAEFEDFVLDEARVSARRAPRKICLS